MFDVYTIGSATRDAFFEGLEFDYHSDDPHMETRKGLCLPLGAKMRAARVTFTTGGGGTNTAVTFARQGLKTAVIGRVGEDVSGKEVAENLAKEGVDTSLLQKDFATPTSYSVILMAEKAERTILVYKGAGDNLSSEEIPWDSIETKWLYLDSIGGKEEIVKAAVELKNKKGVRLMWNPGTSDLARGLDWFKSYLASFDVVSANKDELCTLLCIPYENDAGIMDAFDALVPGVAIMTKGREGVVVSDGKKRYIAGIFPEEKLIDRTGAGDAFGSGFLVGYIKDGMREGIRVGSANGTSVLEHIGAKEGILRSDQLIQDRWQNLSIIEETI